ncbi:hypothetical protein HYN51_00360 [Limnobaculum parvum]|uniref:Uncharacterized protein n=1 Tax=Limnobaculum parvum TaxID=2172103 RepID=A0A2Y9TU04_9GAMM|nr:hypothetical protein HYN51_00360 [Limnobaculum parvum]
MSLPLVITTCVSKPNLQPPPPAIWAMMPASNYLTLLDELFSISELESFENGQKIEYLQAYINENCFSQ